MLVEKENIINEMSLKKKEFEDNIEKIKEEKKILEKYINDMESKQKEEEEKRIKEEEEKKRIEQEEREKKIKEEEENKKKQEEDILYINNEKNMIKDYKIKIQILEYANKDLTEKLANSDNQIDILEKSLETISQKNKKIEKLYKENISQNTLFLNEVKTLKTECDNQNLAFKKLKISNDKNIAIINELNNKLHEYEKENLKLISKLNKQIFEKDYVENNLVKQNNQILINNKEQEEKIQKLIYENNILNQEKDQYKKLLEQIYNHTNKLIKEKNISIIRQQIKDIKNITNTICTNNNDNNIYNYDYCIETNNDINSESNFHIIDNSDILNNLKENESKNNGGKLTFDLKGKKMLIENTKDNTNDNRSLTPIHKDNDNSFISTLEANNIGQNKSYLMPNSGKKRDKILEMIRQERNKKKQLDKELQKIEV
jgi:trichohyalin